MNLPIWQVAVMACLARLASCGVMKSSSENRDVMQTWKDKEPSDLCPARNSRISIYISHPEDCSQFYICENKVPYLKKCPNGLHFNFKLKACDYPETAGCDKDAVEKGKGRIAKGKYDVCPEKNYKFPVYLPDPDDCSRFFVCDNGIPHSKDCFSGLHFNPSINACDYPKNAKCDTDADDKTKGRITGDDVRECPEENSIVPVYLPNPGDCGKFYVCDNGSPKLKTCHPGLHFNPKVNACDFPENAGCKTDNPKGRISDNTLGMCRAEDSTFAEYFPHPDECDKFYICRKGSELLQKCPPGLHFNPKFNVCDYPGNAGCSTGVSVILGGMSFDDASCPDEDSPVLHSHPTDCDKFYECDHGKLVLKSCEPGLNFNDEIRACDQAENAVCEKGMTLASVGVRSPYCPRVDGKLPVFFRHPTNCTVFYMCGNGFAYEFVCPARLHFNLRRRLCDYEENAKCRT